jgi:uncharacterized membrane protein HdeD (DUF308 family)
MTTTSIPDENLAVRTITPGELPVRRHWRWWTVVLRGVAAILFGILALFAPARTFLSLVLVFGIYALIDGVLALALGIRERKYDRGMMIARGIVSILAGVVALVWPNVTALVLLVVIGVWAIIAGILELALAIDLHKEIAHEWLLGLEGALSILFGVLLLLAPLAGAIVLGVWVGAYALVFGGMLIGTGFHLRSLTHAHA